MKYYYAVVHKDEDSAFGVHFPDLPGCFSAADEVEQLVPNACVALELWFEDSDVEVEPRSLEAVRQAAAEELAEGAFLVAVPHIRRTGKQVRANISMDRGMLDAIDRAAAERHLTRSAFLADAARNEIEQRRA
jgi:predicted RNase H-like HicB family nuclease